MTNIEDTTKNLRRLGLSEKQAAIYLALIKHSELRVQEIVTVTDIPRSSVYEELRKLSNLGLIEKIIDHKFTRIRPYPINSLRHNFNEKLFKLEDQMDQIEKVEKNLSKLATVQPQHQTTIRYYNDISGARQLFWNTLKSKTTVYVYSEYGRSKFVGKKFYSDFVQESRDRNIKENVLINPTQRATSLIKRDAGTTLARTHTKDIRFLNNEYLSIKGETFIYDNIYTQINLSVGEINGFEIESRTFVETQRSIFETLWELAKPVKNLV